jgi:hypothetical protein
MVLALIGTVCLLHLAGAFAAPRGSGEAIARATTGSRPNTFVQGSTEFLKPEPALGMSDTESDVQAVDLNVDDVNVNVDVIADVDAVESSNVDATATSMVETDVAAEQLLESIDRAISEQVTVNIEPVEGIAANRKHSDAMASTLAEIPFDFIAESMAFSRSRINEIGKRVADTAKFLARQMDSFETAETTEDDQTIEVASTVANQIVIRNSLKSRNSVAFVVGKEVQQLNPGEVAEFSASSTPTIRFHRGGEFGNASATLTAGTFEFQATSRGWYLEPLDVDDTDR